MQRQLLKILLPTEAALSMCLFTAQALHRADEGEETGKGLRRILTPLVKFRCCRDARKVTGDAMEVRGGSGYIEEWIEPRLLRDSHLGSIWEGTSNIIALDVLRAARRENAHQILGSELRQKLAGAHALPGAVTEPLLTALDRSIEFVERAAQAATAGEHQARQAASALYYSCAAVVMAIEGAALTDRGCVNAGARRNLLAQLVLEHKLSPRDPLAFETQQAGARQLASLLGEHGLVVDSLPAE